MPRKLRKEAFKNPIIAEGMTSSKTRYVEGKKVSVESDDYQIQRGMKILADNKAIHRGDKKQPESTKSVLYFRWKAPKKNATAA